MKESSLFGIQKKGLQPDTLIEYNVFFFVAEAFLNDFVK